MIDRSRIKLWIIRRLLRGQMRVKTGTCSIKLSYAYNWRVRLAHWIDKNAMYRVLYGG